MRLCANPASPITRAVRHFGTAALAVVVLAAQGLGAGPDPTPDEIKFFEERVRPILAGNCYKCHGSENQKGKLRLDLREMALGGGQSGAVIVPGRPDKSLLVEAVRWESLEMPPTGKLTDQQIATLTEWIKRGAPMPKDHGAAEIELRKNRGVITDEDRQWWAFQPIRRSVPPLVGGEAWSRGAIDSFLLARMQAEGLSPAPEADRRTLIRRLSWDLTGLPPSADQIESFLSDERPDAYERLADRLLASPQHGEHWARYWLDLVRYAESDGYKQDAYRPETWHYRDYVIRSLNSDKSYAQFALEQLAGDEAAPDDPDAVIATAYLRLGIYEYNQRDVRSQWAIILNDLTDVTSDVFLGLGVSCARCHDHKFDPILQKDYYRLQAFFSPILWRENVPAARANEIAKYNQQLANWEAQTADIRRQIAEIEDPIRHDASQTTLVKFTDDLQELMAKSAAERTPYEAQLAYLCIFQATDGEGKADIGAKLKGEKKKQWESLKQQLAEHNAARPQPIPLVPSVTDVGPIAPEVAIPGRRNSDPIEPGAPTVLDPNPLSIPTAPNSLTTGRRTALAQWIAAPDNPLTSRVLANRLWQYHFGRGLCESPSDFGRLGQPPSHPELLDNLAADLLEHDWSLKRLHRHMVASAAYRQSSHGPELAKAADKDPQNRLLVRMTVRRLSAEQIRDGAIAVSGELDSRIAGEGDDWSKSSRRAIYLKVYRNKQEPTLDVFDAPDGQFSFPVRNVTTTPNQSLFMINGPWMLVRAKALARRLDDSSATLDQRVAATYRTVLGREPGADESAAALKFLQTSTASGNEALVDLCHVLLNSNEFLYLD